DSNHLGCLLLEVISNLTNPISNGVARRNGVEIPANKKPGETCVSPATSHHNLGAQRWCNGRKKTAFSG
ncbi:hypothetical protein, partial [Serratia symbiotica]|uniref:hypothetical protein n=1 Tax=Serratia symbiotica TaxID=138074 RepID=UPI001E413AE7